MNKTIIKLFSGTLFCLCLFPVTSLAIESSTELTTSSMGEQITEIIKEKNSNSIKEASNEEIKELEVKAEAEEDYFTQRSNQLDLDFTSLTDFPKLTKTIQGIAGSSFTQTVSFSPVDGDSKNLAISMYNELPYRDPSAPNIEKIKRFYSLGQKSAGLGILFEGETNAKPLYFIAEKTKFYQNDNKEIKVLSGVNMDSASDVAEFVVELTASLSEGVGVDYTAEIVNNTKETQKFALVYMTQLDNKNPLYEYTTEDEGYIPNKSIQKFEDGSGYFINNAYRDRFSKIVTEVTFPPKENSELEESEIVEQEEVPTTTHERIIAFTETNDETAPPVEEEPLPEPEKDMTTFIKLKSGIYMKDPNESLKINFHMVTEERNLEILDNPDYRAMDEASGVDLSEYTKMNVIPPLKVDSSAYDGMTSMEHYIIFGKADSSKDTLDNLKGGKLSDSSAKRNTNLNYPYEEENQTTKKTGLGFIFPRIISYDTTKLTASKKFYSYSTQYKKSSGDKLHYQDENMAFQGFGLTTFINEKVDIPAITPTNGSKKGEGRGNHVDEAFISNDKSTVLVYGQYQLGMYSIPIRVTIRSIGTGGKVQATFEYLNKIGENGVNIQTEFGSYFGVQIDINGNTNTGFSPKRSIIRTLGNSRGVYIDDKGFDGIERYYVAFYKDISAEGVSPSNMLIFDTVAYGADGGYMYIQNNPWGWRERGKARDDYNPPFVESQKKDEEIKSRDAKTGAIKEKSIDRPAATFVYENQSLAYNEIGRADLEMRVSDRDIVEYSEPKISSAKKNELNNKDETIYQGIIEQMLDADTSQDDYKPKELNVEVDFTPYVDAKIEDFKVYGNLDSVELDNNLYEMSLDNEQNKMFLTIKDPVTLKNSFDKIIIKQNSKIRYDVPGIEKFYNKAEQQFRLPIKATNSWIIQKTLSTGLVEDLVPLGYYTSGEQLIAYEPKFTATPKENLSVALNSVSGEATKYVDTMYEPEFLFDKLVVGYLADIPPVFDSIGNKAVKTIVSSEAFGQPKEVTTNVVVTNDIKMIVKHVLSGKNEPIYDLLNPELKPVIDGEESIKPTDDLNQILKNYEDKIYQGYSFKDRVGKNSAGDIIDLSQIPTSDFVVELHYDGSLKLDQPKGFDFGKYKLNLTGYDEVRPKITHENETVDLGNHLQITNTLGTGSNWKLSVKQTKPMMSGSSLFKGEMYYIPKLGDSPIIIGENTTPIGENSEVYSIFNKIPLLPESDQKSGLFLDIYSGNKQAVYSDGEITWNLENAL